MSIPLLFNGCFRVETISEIGLILTGSDLKLMNVRILRIAFFMASASQYNRQNAESESRHLSLEKFDESTNVRFDFILFC